jgi:hypothetical protein
MDNDKKKITIVGISNRYQIKKLIEDKNTTTIKYKKHIHQKIDGNNIDMYENQLLFLQQKSTNDKDYDDYPFIKRCITNKINGYRNQDKLKKIYNESLFIKMEEIMDKLLDCHLKCFYCNEDMFILFNIVREMKQWTLDRINNNIGHTNENTLISCLRCNLQRRNKNKDSFFFTKNMNIVKNS